MEKRILGEEKLSQLRKKNAWLIAFLILMSLLLGVWVFIVFYFQNRDTYLLWIFLGSLVSSVFIIIILYGFLMMGRPLWSYMKLNSKVLIHDTIQNKVKLVSDSDAVNSFYGIKAKGILVEEVDEHNQWIIRYQEDEEVLLLPEKTYIVETYDDFIVSFKEDA